jgi:AraC-like DNA-binding protein
MTDSTAWSWIAPRSLPGERRLSIRLTWPFVRVAGGDRADMDVLAREGIGLAEFADPDTRLRHAAAMELLGRALNRTADPALGLRAAENLEPGDLDVLEHVMRTCPNLREAIACSVRYTHLMHEATDIVLEEGADFATVYWRITDAVPQAPAANDFVVASAVSLWRRHTGVQRLPVEIHFEHEDPTSAADYARIFDCPVKLGMPQNAIVMRRSSLDLPLPRADRGLHAAFDLHARTLLERLRKDDGVSVRAREIMLAQLSNGDTSMETIARKLAMSIATLRRRLEEEGTSHREILDNARYQLAVRYLRDRRLATSEVAFLLGFSHVTALHKAFKRWTGGVTPAEFRSRSRVRLPEQQQSA